jgi:hypothetical protein
MVLVKGPCLIVAKDIAQEMNDCQTSAMKITIGMD